jgi:putative Mn2+ efflux pump MntP
MNKLFDLRFVIGLFFTVVGLLIVVYSFVTSREIERQDINQWAGIAFLVFGIFMIVLSLRKDANDELLEDAKHR